MYILIIGKPPFEINNVKETYKRIKMGNYSFPENEVISGPAKDLIRSSIRSSKKIKTRQNIKT